MNCAIPVGDGSDVERYAEAAKKTGRPARVHLKIDTGMGRLGVRPEHAPAIASRIASSDDLSLEGVWTHFADAAGPAGRAQLDRFLAVRAALGRHAPRALLHAANSAGTIALPASRLDMVRVGTLLYGQGPAGVDAPFPLKDPFAWHATVVSVRELPAGATVGYGAEWKAPHLDTRGDDPHRVCGRVRDWSQPRVRSRSPKLRGSAVASRRSPSDASNRRGSCGSATARRPSWDASRCRR